MSRFLKRNPFAGSVRLAKKKRKRQPKPHARRHLVQSLERRDHPGSMLEVSAIALLGRPDGESKDPIDQMLRTAEDMHARREQYERLTNLKRSQAAEPLRHDGAEPAHSTGSSKLSNHDRDTNLDRRAATNRLLDRSFPNANQPAPNPLLGSISDTFVSAGLDQLPDSAAASATGRSSIGPGINAGASGGGANGGGGGGSNVPIAQATDRAGTAMTSTATPPASGNSGGGTSSDASSSPTATPAGDAAATSEAATPNAISTALPLPSTESADTSSTSDRGSNGKITGPINPDTSQSPDATSGNETLVVPSQFAATELLSIAGRDADGPTIDLATSTDARGEGRFLITGKITQTVAKDSELQLYSVRDGRIRSLGEAVLDDSGDDAGAFRAVGVGRVNMGDDVMLHVAPADGSIGSVSALYQVRGSDDSDRDGVSGELESLAARGDGNDDGLLDAMQSGVATIPDATTGKPTTIDAAGARLASVRSVTPSQAMSDHRLPLGLFEFELHDVPLGGVQAVDIHLPQDEPVDGWFKEDSKTGRLNEFYFDGTTGAIANEFGFTLFIQDGGRGDEDGVANGVIIDPGGPGYAGSITIDCNGGDPLADWVTNQFGGSDTGHGTVVADGAEVLASEGDSLLVTMTRPITVPDNPSWLIVGFEAFLDETTDDRINDAFEIALLDADGYSVVPTIDVNRDSYFNITESVGAIEGDNTYHYRNNPDDYLSGFVDLDISSLNPGQELSLVMRLVNNDGDTGSWFRVTCDRPIPTATDDFYTTMQDTVLYATDPVLTANDFDDDARTITVVTGSVTQPSHGSVSVDRDGEFTYTPGPGFFGDDSFTYHATNGLFSSATAATVHVTVHRGSSPPTITDDEYTVAEDSVLIVGAPGVLANDTDIDAGPLTSVIEDPPAHGSVSLASDGSFTYMPDADFYGSDTLTYSASDSNGESETASVIITVTPVDDVIDDAMSTVEGTPIDGNVSVNDLFLAAATFVVHSDATGGTVTSSSNDGTFTYTPDLDFVGVDSFTYTATDVNGSAETGTVSITVTPHHSDGVCYPPLDFDTAPDGSDTTAGMIATDMWADWGITINSSKSTKPPMLFDSANPTGGDPDLGTANGDFGGPGIGRGGRAGAVGENADPLGMVLIISEDGDASDPDDNAAGGTLIFHFDTPATIDSIGLLDIDNGQNRVGLFDAQDHLLTTVDATNVGDNGFQRLTLDTANVSRMEVVLAGSGAVTDLPFCTSTSSPVTYSMPASVDEASLITLNLSSTESVTQWFVDWGDGANQTITDGAMFASHVYDDGDITHEVHFWAETASGIYSTDTSVAVNNVDPVLTISAPATVAEGVDFNLDLSEIDPGEDTIYAWQINWGDGTPEQWVDGNPASIPYRFAQPGTYAVSATAFDEDAPHQGSFNEIAGQVIVEAENFQSAADGTGKASNHDWVQRFDRDASSGEYLRATPSTRVNTGDSTKGPRRDYSVNVAMAGTFYVWVRMKGASSNDDSVHLGIDGRPATYGRSGMVGNSRNWTWVDSVNNRRGKDRVTVTFDSPGIHTLNLWMREDGTAVDKILLTRGANATPTDFAMSETYIVGGGYHSNTVFVNVDAVHHAPVANDDSYETDEDIRLDIAASGVLNNDVDVDGDTLDAILMQPAAHGDVALHEDGSFRYTPDSDYHGSDQFSYRVFDGVDYSGVATVALTIHSVNDAPVANNDAYVTDAGIALHVIASDGLLDNDYDSDRDAFTISSITSVNPSSAGTFSSTDAGSFDYVPASGFSGQVTLEYMVTDGIATSAPATVRITVTSLQEFAKFYVVDHSRHEVFQYDDGGDFIENWGYDTSNRSRGITANASGDTLWTVTAGHDIVVYTPDGAEIGKWQARINSSKNKPKNLNAAEGVATDGTNLWIVDRAKDTVLYFADGAAHRSGDFHATTHFNLHPGNKNASGIATDGTNLYVLNNKNHSPRVFVYSLSGQYLGDWELNVGGGNHDLQGITTNPSGGTELWVVDKKTDEVYYFPYGTSYRNGCHTKTSDFALHPDNRNPYGIADPPPAAFTPTIAWNSATGGNWNDPANWTDLVDSNAARVPDANDRVLIDIPGGDFEVTVTGGYDADYNPLPAMQAARLYSSDPIVVTYDGGLNLSGPSEIDRLTISSGTVQSDGDLVVRQNLDWSGGTLAGDGTFTLIGVGLIHGTSTKSIGTTFINEGDVTLRDYAPLEIGRKVPVGSYYEYEYYPGTLHNRASGTIDIQSDADITDAFSIDNANGIMATGGLMHNEGTLKKTQGTDVTFIGVPFENDGSVNASAVVSVELGTLQIRGPGVSSGQFIVGESRTLQLAPQLDDNAGYDPVDLDTPLLTLTSAATISGDGKLEITQGVSEISGDVNVGSVVVNSGGVNFNGSLSTDSLQVSGGEIRIDVAAPISIDYVTVSGGTLDDDSGLLVAHEFLISGTPKIQGDAATQVSGSMQMNSVPWSGNPELIDHTLLLQGTTDWLHGRMVVDGAAQIINSGVLNVTGDGSVTVLSDGYGTPSFTGSFINEGTINHNGTNYFTIDIPFQTSGNVYVAPSNTLALGSSEPVVVSDGLFTLDNATLQLTPSYYGEDDGVLQVDGGQIVASGRITGSIENHASLAINGSPSTLQVDGNFTQTVSGVTRLRIQGLTAGSEYDQIQVNGLISLDGDLEILRDWETQVGDQFTLLTNEDDLYDATQNQNIVDPVLGNFAEKLEWKPWVLDNEIFRVTYQGGTGNEILLRHSGPGIEVGDVRVDEGSDPNQIIEVPVTLDAPSLFSVSIDYATQDGLAVAGMDYQQSSGTLVFAPGQTEAMIEIVVPGNREANPTRDFSVTLSSPVAGTVLDDTASVIIVDDDYSGVPDNLGKEFFLAIPENAAAYQDDLPGEDATINRFLVVLVSEFDTSGSISAPWADLDLDFDLVAGETKQFYMPASLEPIGSGTSGNVQDGFVLPTAIRITADHEIAVYGLAAQFATTDGFMVLPSDTIGQNYILTSYPSDPQLNEHSGTQFQVIGTVDRTSVTITAIDGTSREVQLDRGDVFSQKDLRDLADFTGTRIHASEKVAVISGNTCANVPIGFTTCDTLIEQLPPVETLGKQFVVNKLAGKGPDVIRIVAVNDSTVVSIGETQIALSANEVYETTLPASISVISNQPIQLAQFATGSQADQVGDPFMILVPPTEQFLSSYILSSEFPRSNDNYLGLTVPNSIISEIMINGEYLDPAKFVAVAGTDFSVANLSIEEGGNTVRGPLPFGVTAYGYSYDESYGYIGGQAFVPIDVTPEIQLDPDFTRLPVGNVHDVIATVSDQDGNLLNGVRIDYAIDGPNAGIGSVRTDASGLATILVNGQFSGLDTITATAIGATDTAQVDWFSAMPTIDVTSPPFGYSSETGQSVLISGRARSGDDNATIVSLTIDGQRIETVDAAGNFFTSTELPFGKSSYEFEVINSLGESATTTHRLEGLLPGNDAHRFDSLVDVSAIVDLYATTSFDARVDQLHAELSIVNNGAFPISNPLWVGVRNVSDPSVEVMGFDGLWEDGTPYYDLSSLAGGDQLLPGASTLFDAIAFHVPERRAFDYELVLLGAKNEAPAVTSIPVISARGGVGETYTAQVTSRDPDGDALTLELVSGPQGMILVDNGDGTGQLNWDDVPADLANYPVTIRATDSRGAATTQSYVISIADGSINRPPVFTSHPVTETSANQPYAYDSFASDADGDRLAYSLSVVRTDDPASTELAGLSGSGSFMTIDPNSGEIHCLPSGPDAGDYSAIITADDGRGGIVKQRYTLRVNPVEGNHAPAFTSSPAESLTAGASFRYQASAVDPDGDSLSFSIQSAPAGASMSATGLLSFEVPSGVNATYDFIVEVTDGNGNTIRQTFTLAGVDATPATLAGRVYHDADEDQSFDDASDTPLANTIVYLDTNSNLHFDIGESSTTTDAAGLYTIDSLAGNYRVGFVRADQWATVAPASLVHQGTTSADATVNNLDFVVKQRPQLNSDPQIISAPPRVARFFEPFIYDVDATDPDGDSLTYQLLDGPDGVTINSITGEIRWLPEPPVFHVGTISVRVSDGRGGFARQNFFPEFTFANEAPSITSQPSAVPTVDVPFHYQVTATDPDGDVLFYSVDPMSDSLGVMIDPATGLLTWTPADTAATDVTVSVEDGRGSRASQTFTLHPTTDAFPVLDVVPSIRIPVGIEMEVLINASDPLGDAVSVELQPAAIAAGAQIVQRDLDGDTITERVLVFTPPIVGGFTLPIAAFDPAGQTVTSVVFVNAYDPALASGNQAPTGIVVPTPMLYRDQPVRVTATVDDPEQDPILWSIEAVGDPMGGPQINPNTGVITWTPTTPGNVTVMVTAADVAGGVVTQTATYTILENAPPRFVSTPVRGGAIGTEYAYSSHAEDPNDDETNRLIYHANIVPSIGSFGTDYRSWPSTNFDVNPNTGVLDWNPSEAGDYLVTLIATDPHGALGSQSFFVSIINDNGQNSLPDLLTEPAPRFPLSPPAGQGSVGVPLDYQARALDADNDPLTYELVSGPDGLVVTAAGRVRYTPNDSSIGTSGSYTVRVTDGRGGEDTETFTYSVTTDAAASNRSPNITSKPSTRTPLSRPYIYNVDAADPDGDTVRFELDTAPAGTSIDSVTGLITWSPTLSDLGTHPITVTAIDIAGAASSQTFALEVVRGDTSPRITSSPPVTSRVGDYYHYGINARDDDGDTVTFLLGPGTDPNFPMTIDTLTGILSGTTTIEATYNIEIIAVDSTARFDSQIYQLTVDAASTAFDPNNPPTSIANNLAPTITSAPRGFGFVGSDYRYDLAAVDTDIARGDVLTWSLTSQPATTVNPINFDAPTHTLTWQPDASELDGLFSFEVRVTDMMGAYSTQSWSVRVRPENIAPVVSLIPDQTLAAGASLKIDVHASDANLDTVVYAVDAASAERGITIDELGRLRWATSDDDRDDSPLEIIVTASDGYLSDSATFALTLTDDEVAPVVRLSASELSVSVGGFVDLAVRSSDNVGVVSETLTLVSVTDFHGNVIELNQPIDLTLTSDARLNTLPSHLGSISLVASAIDKAGRVGTSDPLTILVFDPSDTTRPQVTLLNPGTGDRPQGPTDILGSVSDDSSTGLMWSLSVAEVGSVYPPREVASGLGPFTAEVIGLFDPTILRDGAYEITLSATDSGNNIASDTKIVDVKTDLKLGNFSISFVDLQVPVAGMPISITRSYDSLDADVSGDFGFGWSLEVDMPKLLLSQASTGAPSFAGYPTFVNGTRMTVVTPEGDTEGFTFKWVAASDGLAGIGLSHTYRPSFIPDPGNQYSLVPPVGTGQFRRLTENGPYQDDYGRQYSGQDPTFGGVYQLKQSDPRGQQIDYDILVGTRGATEMTAHRMKDKYGNSSEVRPDGIYSNRGRSVEFNRDSRGRITDITDPRGGQLVYQYDAAGRLVAFYDRRAMQSISDGIADNEFEPTRFEYDPDFTDAGGSAIAGIENYLTKIIDPLGVTAIQTQYDPATGRVLALVDADGNPASLDYDITAEGATLSSQSTGYSTSQSSFDAYGRLDSEISASGQETRYTYQGDQRYPYQTVQIIGAPDGPDSWYTRSGDDRVTTRQYHAEFDGAVTEETDPDGNTTVTAYNTWGYDRGTPDKVFNLATGETTDYHWFDATGDGQLELLTQTDSYGNVTQFGYDSLGNVNQLTQSNTNTGTSITSGFTFDNFGDLVQVIDQDGNVREILYNENGDQTGTLFYHYPTDQRPPEGFPLPSPDSPIPTEFTADDFPPTRTQLRTENDINFAGDVTGSRTYVTEQTFDPVTFTYIGGETTIRNESGTVEFDALGRPYRSTDENGRASETIFDARGLAIETRTESPDEGGAGVWLVSRTVFDTEGRAIYSTGSFPESVFTDSPEQITGTHSIYDGNVPIDLDDDGVLEADEPGHGTGRMLKSEQLLGLDIQVVAPTPTSPTPSSVLSSAGTLVSFSRSFYDDNNRITSTESDYGLRTQTLYDDNSRVIESRSETVASDGTRSWLVSRTIYDHTGKVLATTDRFLVPADTPLGNDPIDPDTGLPVPVTTQITKPIYDERNRTIATERYTDSTVSSFQTSPFSLQTSAFQIADQGELESVSETLYDAGGRAWRTISGRVPIASLSPEALAQHQALADFDIYPGGADRYQQLAGTGDELSTGVITDTLFDDRGRKFASLGHPLPAEDIGLGDQYAGKLIRHRSETIFNRNGRAESQRSGIAQISEPDGNFIALDDTESIESRSHVDALGNVVRMDYVVDGNVDSYTQTRFDDESRPIAEMQQTAENITAFWDESNQTYRVSSITLDATSPYEITAAPGDFIPTKVYHYDSDDRLDGLHLALISPSDVDAQPVRPRYQYKFDSRGNQTSIIDPLGRETHFTFTDRGQQETRTLPLGFGPDGRRSTTDDPASAANSQQLGANSFREATTYDDRGRQSRHVSFEGVVSENIYDDFGRLSAINYYTSESDLETGLVSEREEYVFDNYGRRVSMARYQSNDPAGSRLPDSQLPLSESSSFTLTRTEATLFDTRGRILHEITPEGTLSYGYNASSQQTFVAVNADLSGFLPADPTRAERVTYNGYNILNQLVSVQEDETPQEANSHDVEASYGFDFQGRMRSIATGTTHAMPSLLSVMQFDRLGRLDMMTERKLTANGYELSARYDYAVRPDGKRTALYEQHWFDLNHDEELTANELKANNYSWHYDDLNRLTDEVIDHWDDTFDQTESFIYDLTGNRTQLDRDQGNDSTIDEAITYSYDANDRLFDEVLDSIVDADDATTSYTYDHTQQTAKEAFVGIAGAQLIAKSSQLFAYNLQGRMASVTNEAYTSGTLSSRERTHYSYDSKSFRISLVTETGTTLSSDVSTENWQLKTETQFLADAHNHTGFTQTIRETKVENGHTLITDYTFGHDEISQRVHGEKGDGTTIDQTLAFGHDGHGSVRILYDLAVAIAPIAQAMTYSAYGELLALHNTLGTPLANTARLTSLGYSGEHFDANAQQQYLRARFYSPTTGRFNRLDPFTGNTQDPQSLHKYAYTHGEPVQSIDPSGRRSLAARMAVSAIHTTISVVSHPAVVRLAKESVLASLVYGKEMMSQVPTQIPGPLLLKAKSYAVLAVAAYGAASPFPANDIGFDELPGEVDHNSTSGFVGRLYRHRTTQEVVVAFAGTDITTVQDWYNNVGQGLFGVSEQYSEALDLAKKAVRMYGQVHFVGHSLGGGMASAAALVTGLQATTFNAAGVNPKTIAPFGAGLAFAENSIDAFRVIGDPLSTMQEIEPSRLGVAARNFSRGRLAMLLNVAGLSMPDGTGRDYWLESPVLEIFSRHKMGVVREALDNV